MKNLLQLIGSGARSFAKARASGLRVRRRRATGHLAFSVSSPRGINVVRLALESGRALGECVKANGKPCIGFSRTGRCYHVARALMFVCATAKTPLQK